MDRPPSNLYTQQVCSIQIRGLALSATARCIVTELPMCLIVKSCGEFWIHTSANQHLNIYATLPLFMPGGFGMGMKVCLVVMCRAGDAEVRWALANKWLALPTFKVCVYKLKAMLQCRNMKSMQRGEKKRQGWKKYANLPKIVCSLNSWMHLQTGGHTLLNWTCVPFPALPKLNDACWEQVCKHVPPPPLHACKLISYWTAVMHNLENNNNCEENPFALLAVEFSAELLKCWVSLCSSLRIRTKAKL